MSSRSTPTEDNAAEKVPVYYRNINLWEIQRKLWEIGHKHGMPTMQSDRAKKTT